MNPATRLTALLDQLTAYSPSEPSEPALSVWTKVLALPAAGRDMEDQVVAALQSVRAEIDLASSMLDAHGIPPPLYINQFGRLRDVASATRVNNAWNGVVGNLTPTDVRLAFAWSAVTLPSEEEELSAQQRVAFASDFDRL